jgi:hypothetical protein
MALLATHIRFALDLSSKYKPDILDQYIIGSLYPDSRYRTQTDRLLTHPKEYTSWKISDIDSFTKGWHAHLLCDQVGLEYTKVIFSDIFTEDQIVQNSPNWITLTALKVLSDLDSVKVVNIKDYLSDLKFIHPVHSENVADLVSYYKETFEAYKVDPILTIDSYRNIFSAVGLIPDTIEEIIDTAKTMSKDEKVINRLEKLYIQTINKANILLNQWQDDSSK